ncbi:hypothetical protein CC77DRAFT_693559 [Alternaria alternata]|uniref:Uncharacterized protein n=1 Tax=Alternaria alternata TaxID=5599 RepID=A0A177DWB5_ALTAL|nr:hypothetical protein CC77DRAFT_693559 [Alternaria alternata]OAG23089.1 hypothetical protein CC77DRAFT_693559 [Alternaria alternata]
MTSYTLRSCENRPVAFRMTLISIVPETLILILSTSISSNPIEGFSHEYHSNNSTTSYKP